MTKRRPFTRYTSCALFNCLKHGEPEHREWLAEAIEAFRLGKPRPKPRG